MSRTALHLSPQRDFYGDTLAQTVDCFGRFAEAESEATRTADWRSHELYHRFVLGAGDRLLSWGEDGTKALRKLAAPSENDVHVRMCAAQFLIWRDEARARTALRVASREKNLTGYLAHGFLSLWGEGHLDPPPSLMVIMERAT